MSIFIKGASSTNVRIASSMYLFLNGGRSPLSVPFASVQPSTPSTRFSHDRTGAHAHGFSSLATFGPRLASPRDARTVATCVRRKLSERVSATSSWSVMQFDS